MEDSVSPQISHRHLRLSDKPTCSSPRSKLRAGGDRSFRSAALTELERKHGNGGKANPSAPSEEDNQTLLHESGWDQKSRNPWLQSGLIKIGSSNFHLLIRETLFVRSCAKNLCSVPRALESKSCCFVWKPKPRLGLSHLIHAWMNIQRKPLCAFHCG